MLRNCLARFLTMRLSFVKAVLHFRKMIFTTAVIVLLAFGFALFWFYYTAPPAPDFQQIIREHRSSEGLLYDRNGTLLHEIRVDRQRRRLDWIALADVSPAVLEALTAAEDARYHTHRGVDWWATVGAALRNLAGDGRGASTISMQVASLVDPSLAPRRIRRSGMQKARQMRAALALEKSWTKPEILEAYLNLVSFRGEMQGIAATSRGLFQKDPHGIDRREALLLAALVRSPNSDAGRVLSRAEALGRRLGWLTEDEKLPPSVERAVAGLYFVVPRADFAPHVAWSLLPPAALQTGSARVTSTIDYDLQRYAVEALRNRLSALQGRNVEDAALLVVENRTGEVWAYLGNNGQKTDARYVDGNTALRQAGSILKPFLYALAFDQRLVTPASLLDDSALEIPVLGGVYRPRNYDNQFHGLVTARQALASSLNVPAVRTLNVVGIDPFLSTLRRLGFRRLEGSEYYGPSLALGSADVCLRDLVDAYRALANQGSFQPSRLTSHQALPEPVRVFSPEAAFLVSDILSDRESREMTFGLENPLSTRFWTAVKTGTSKDMRDNWCVGFSERFTVGVWVGNFSGMPMWHVSGMSGAAPLWLEVMNYLHRDLASRPPETPRGIRAVESRFPDLGTSRTEFYVRGTESETVTSGRSGASRAIVYPVNGMILALDPDIPARRQIVLFEARTGGIVVRWRLNGEPLPEVDSVIKWVPEAGKHKLVLEDADGRSIDSVEFEVRGPTVRKSTTADSINVVRPESGSGISPDQTARN
jgi:penicillin-binding protein 1C